MHLHKEELQVLSVHVIKGRKEVRTLIWPPGHLTTSMMADVGSPTDYMHLDMQAQVDGATSCTLASLKMRLLGIRHVYSPFLLWTGFLSAHISRQTLGSTGMSCSIKVW